MTEENAVPAPPVDVAASSDPCPTGTTTSPDVTITEDPGPAPSGDAPVDDGSVDPLADDNGNPNVIPIATEENPSA